MEKFSAEAANCRKGFRDLCGICFKGLFFYVMCAWITNSGQSVEVQVCFV